MKNTFISLIFLVTFASASAGIIPLDDVFVKAIGQIESNNNDYAVGDNGKSISRYQIQRAAFLDAKQYDKSIRFSYSKQSLTDEANARKVMTAYLNRYAKEAIKNRDYETLARKWNGGPKGHLKSATIKYWKKFQKALTTQKKFANLTP